MGVGESDWTRHFVTERPQNRELEIDGLDMYRLALWA
jgi:hypothetical protein